jgi:hypothetical protein
MLFTTTKTKVKDKLAPVQSMEAYGGVEVWLPPFLTSTLHVGKWSASRPGLHTTHGGRALLPAEYEAGWVGRGPEPVWKFLR